MSDMPPAETQHPASKAVTESDAERVERELRDTRARLKQVDPTWDNDEYLSLFGRLVDLEQQRRHLNQPQNHNADERRLVNACELLSHLPDQGHRLLTEERERLGEGATEAAVLTAAGFRVIHENLLGEPRPRAPHMDGGHGHVRPRPDGAKAKCGGPRMCCECAAELAALLSTPGGLDVQSIPGGIRVVRAEQNVRLRLETLTTAAPWMHVQGNYVRIADQVTYKVTDWDLAACALVCTRIDPPENEPMHLTEAMAVLSALPSDQADQLMVQARNQLGTDAAFDDVVIAAAAAGKGQA